MDKTKLIREIIYKNRNDIAFVIGNGINRHFFGSKIKSWNELIENLTNIFLSEAPPNTEDFSLTELFDLIELEATSYEDIINEYIECLKNKKYNDLPRVNPLDFDTALKIANAPGNSNNIANDISKSESFETFNKVYAEYLKGCRKWCMRNRDDYEILTDEECVGHFMDVTSNPIKINMMKNIVKQKVIQCFSRELSSPDLTALMIFFRDLEVPVMTTNYDNLMSQSLGLFKYNMGESFTDFYPWNVYFSSKELEHPISDFGIWHINGMVNYPRSIKLGISDYMGNVERVRKMLHSHDFNEFFNGKNQKNWAGYYTWLHIIFNKNLFFFGLQLDKNEVFLRWLLIQRAKYSQMYNRHLKGWYVDKDIDENKKYFLKKVGFDVIDISDFHELYDSFMMV